MNDSNPAPEPSSSSPSPLSTRKPDSVEPSPLRALGALALALAGVLIVVLLARRASGSEIPDLAGRNLVWFRTPATGHVDLGGTPIEAVRGNWIQLQVESGKPSRWFNLNSFDSFAVE